MKNLFLLASMFFATTAFAQGPVFGDSTKSEFTSDSVILNSSMTESNGPIRYFGDIFGPKWTVRWDLVDTSHAPKLIENRVVMSLNDRLVNEIYLRASDNIVQISDILVVLSNGQTMHLDQGTGNLRDGQSLRLQLDYRYSLRIERIEVAMTSPNLFGSRGTLVTHVGLAE